MTLAISDKYFAELMEQFAPYENNPYLAVGVSGGSDSMALCFLVSRWVKANCGKVLALTVDHGLRVESSDEAKTVGLWMEKLGIEHKILPWVGDKPKSAIHETARQARYELLSEECKSRSIKHLLVAHTQDDQAETVIMRLCKGSGPDGLAGIPASRNINNIRLIRPLLGVSREALIATCRGAQLSWVDDKSNYSDVFTRARIRKIIKLLEPEGLTRETLAATATRCASQKILSEYLVSDFINKHVSVYPEGWCKVSVAGLLEAPRELLVKVIGQLAMSIGGNERLPKLYKLEIAADRILSGVRKMWTLGGCLFFIRKGELYVCREEIAVASPIEIRPGEEILWDARFRISLSADVYRSLQLKALGQGKAIEIKRDANLTKRLAAIPRFALYTMPSLWDGEKLVHLQGVVEQANIKVTFAPRRLVNYTS